MKLDLEQILRHETKEKTKLTGPHQNEKLLYIKGHFQQVKRQCTE